MELKYDAPGAEAGGKAMRVQVYLARAGAASRRAAETLIAQGRVSVNGITVTALGTKAAPGDRVCLDGLPLALETRFRYLALHKPPEYLCSAADPQGRALALDLLPKDIPERLYSVGRLDYRSSGLIIYTNDGGFAAKAGHPSSGIVKEYTVETSGPIPQEALDSFARGMVIEGVSYKAQAAEPLGKNKARIMLVEGKNREIRRVLSYFHLHPVRLCRMRIGPVSLGGLKAGGSRPLAKEEVAFFKSLRNSGSGERGETGETGGE
ncbi:MAG: rRNA pseudouridine synthase [Spirochaetaceae bacterium]|jgi:23S rRNA pseudouridine2605 synthase|nr:rRNA pseudouridine synthase [Spirochaetaceae bacterium]